MITTEIRYFRHNPFDPLHSFRQIKDSFELAEQDARTDRYAQLEASTLVGIKLREGALEVKSLVKSFRKNDYRIQQWEKISVGDSSQFNSFTDVTKKRWLAFFDIDGKPCDLNERGQCQLELSEVKVNDKKYLSICLESSGEDQHQSLFSLLHKLEKHAAFQKFMANAEAKSYPEFLIRN